MKHLHLGVILLTLKWSYSQEEPGEVTHEATEEELDSENPLSRRFYIGGVLPDEDLEKYFHRTIGLLNFDGVSVSSTCTLYHVTFASSGSPVRDARLVCNKLIAEGVFAMVIGGRNMSSAATSAISYTGGFYHIPVIGTTARESAFSDKNIHVSFLRTVPPFSHQVDVWVELLRMFKYRKAVFIHSSDSDGRSLLGRLRSLAETTQDDKAVKIASIVEFEPGDKHVSDTLKPLKDSLVRVFLLFADKYDADILLMEAAKMNLTGEDSIWVLAEGALGAKHVPVGALGIRLKHSNDQKAHIADSLRLVTLALRKIHDHTPELIIRPPDTCEREEPWNITGKLLFKAIQEQVLYDGKTGKVAFDSQGDRKYAEYFIVNKQNDDEDTIDKMTQIGDYFYDKENNKMELHLNESRIVWGGGKRKIPTGISVPRNLKVLTIEETPFLYAEDFSKNEGLCTQKDESICYWTDPSSKETKVKCCFGYCVELLRKLANTNDFSFTLHLSSDKEFGENYFGDKGQTVWSGMIGELVNKSRGADMIVAPLTINPERALAIDFSKPFKYQGITILVKKAQRSTALVSILQPFQFNLWLMLLATVHAIALLVWLLDRLSPMFKNEGTESDSLKISEAFWFSWGVILNSGLGEGTPRCLSSRFMSLIWAGFAMIIVASYTANLAAFLVLEDHGETISGINDAKLRNPVDDFLFATVKGSAVDMFFRRKTEWANMYRVMEANNYGSTEEAIKAVKNGTLKAFIWDSSRLEYEASQDCNLVTVGELFGRSGYGIGIRKGLFWSEKITLDILELHESGFMADLDEKWIWEGGPECPPDRTNSPQRLGLANLEGIFMMIVGGVVAGTVLILIELMYKKYQSCSGTKDSRECQTKNGKPKEACEFCEEKKKEPENLLCHFCSALAASELPSQGLTPGAQSFSDEVETRLGRSENIPTKLKERTPRQWLQMQLDMKEKNKSLSDKDAICLHSLSKDALRNLIDFVDGDRVEAIPFICECHDKTCYQNESDSESSASSMECLSEGPDSIISGEFSCPRLQEVTGRTFETLPDVVFS